MAKAIFVTGNAHKAKYFSELVGLPIEHQGVNGHEIQSLELREIAEHKVRLAFDQIKKPVIVEDVSLVINSMGRLPGPYVKWFIEELGLERICRLADVSDDRKAVAGCVYAYFDGKILKYFEGSLEGTIVDHPRGDNGFGWNPTFIPQGTEQTLGEMDDETFKKFYIRIKPILEIKEFLAGLDK